MGKQGKPKAEAKEIAVPAAEVKKVEEAPAAKPAAAAKEETVSAEQYDAVKEARAKLASKFADVRTGGPGTVRRRV